MGQAVQNQNLNKLLMRLAMYFLFLLANNLVNAQVYTKKQTRQRFAQLNIGFGFQTNLGGSTKYLDAIENVQTLILSNSACPRIKQEFNGDSNVQASTWFVGNGRIDLSLF